jgi:hypothetical protein
MLPTLGGFFIVGGTSAGSPQWAAIVALAKQAKGSPLGFINPTLNQIACSSRCSQDFHDITIGNDELVNTPVGNSATTGLGCGDRLGNAECDEPGPWPRLATVLHALTNRINRPYNGPPWGGPLRLAPVRTGLTLRAMRPGTVLGALLIFAGVVALSVGGFSFTSREKVAEVGPVKVTTEKSHSVPIPTVVAGLAVIAGVVLIVASSRKAR